MSRQAHLPPRCPFQKKTITRQIHGPVFPALDKDTDSHPRHHKSVSQSSIDEEQPAWLDDLLNDSESNSNGRLHRRSASDSLTLLDDLVPLASLDQLNESDNFASCETDGGLESAIYGPNSPRGKGKSTFPENAMVLALSEYVSHRNMDHLDETICVSGAAHFGSVEDASGSAGEINAETKPVKRHPGQRSRVRKLQYIAELERTVDILQKLESDLAARAASLLQQRHSLSVENNKLKQQLFRLQQQKLIVDGKYQTLRKGYERLKTSSAHATKKFSTNLRPSRDTELATPQTTWQMLDMGKLDLS